jgi:hypothetical protein
MKSSSFELFAVAYDETSLGLVKQSGFSVLDHLDNARSDWFEYWPIRHFLMDKKLPDNTWYGFVSPRFQEKTGLNAAGVIDVITKMESSQAEVDVVLFSPQPDMGAFFINVFEQGEMFHPGLMAAALAVFDALGMNHPLRTMIMDSRQTVFSNYFVAKAPFWKSWFEVTEKIFEMAEEPSHPLASMLTSPTSYRDGSHQKVFLVERVASLLLTVQSRWKVRTADTFSFAWSSFESFNKHRELAYQSDALKIAFRETGARYYMDAYEKIRLNIGK